MAKDKISMPSGTAGITRYWEGNTSKVTFSPGHVIVLSIIVVVIILALHMFGNSILGL
ncbi:MAG: preprotein translocase subunit Sec61beta [Candidatus Nanoarchaeia archaeon]